MEKPILRTRLAHPSKGFFQTAKQSISAKKTTEL
jgi:hypothetical protein